MKSFWSGSRDSLGEIVRTAGQFASKAPYTGLLLFCLLGVL